LTSIGLLNQPINASLRDVLFFFCVFFIGLIFDSIVKPRRTMRTSFFRPYIAATLVKYPPHCA
jgi:uncharacterized membrane protein